LCVTSQTEINHFLYKFKFFAQNPQCFTFEERDKNMRDLAELGITPPQTKNIICELTYRNYSSGPDPDKDVSYPNNNTWKFGYDLDGTEIYIKLCDDFSNKVAKCLSFHKAKHTITYPHKEG